MVGLHTYFLIHSFLLNLQLSECKIEKMFTSVLRRLVVFAFCSWLFCLKKGVWIVLLSMIMSLLRLAFSESGGMEDGSGMRVNVTCPPNLQCHELPPYCLDCGFDYNCTYGDTTMAMCSPFDSVECTVRQI
jgi:hypothetical protein